VRRKLDLETWVRRPHFEFFNAFEEPYYGVCVSVDCTIAYSFAKQNGFSFFLYYLYRSLGAAQSVEAFRYRTEEGEVFIYDRIDAGSAIDRSNGTFGYGHILYHVDLNQFMQDAKREVERVRGSIDLTRTTAANVIRYSPLPWIDFTSLSHARMFAMPDSCPRISFGKITERDGKRSMPVSIHVHHGLVDGLHVGQYIDRFQELMNTR
jgi:chloramphenicol O-acetyltransferase type A